MAPAPSVDPVSIVEHMQEALGTLRQRIAEPGPLPIGARAQAAEKIQMLAGMLGNLKLTLRRVAGEPNA